MTIEKKPLYISIDFEDIYNDYLKRLFGQTDYIVKEKFQKWHRHVDVSLWELSFQLCHEAQPKNKQHIDLQKILNEGYMFGVYVCSRTFHI